MKISSFLIVILALLGQITFAQTGNFGIGTTTPGSKLTVNGSFAAAYTAVAGNYTMTVADFYVVSNSASNSTITLPAALAVGSGNYKGRLYEIKNTHTTSTLTIAGNGAELIDNTGGTGVATVSVLPGDGVLLVSNGNTSGTTWEVVSYHSAVPTKDYDWMKAGNQVPSNPGDTIVNIYHIGGNVGIATPAPASKLHVVGGVTIQDGTQGAGKIFVSDAMGLGSWQSPAQTKEILALGNATTQTVLTGVAAGGGATLTNFTQLVNTIPGASFNTATDAVSLPQGTFEIAVSYELTSTGACPAAGFMLNSYFIDFPNGGVNMRVHANSPSVCGGVGSSVHSALWVTTVTIPAGGQNWTMHVGRGSGGNYADAVNLSTSSRVLVKKIL